MRFRHYTTMLFGAIFALPACAGLTAAAAPAPPPVAGGCYGGSLTTTNIPGSGSGGMDTNVTGGLNNCHSPQLRRVRGGMLNVRYPFNAATGNVGSGAGGNPADGTVAWSNGTVSAISGNWVTAPAGQNAISVLNVFRGPGAGHRMVIGTRQLAESGSVGGGSGGSGSIMVTSAVFVA